ncbi:hypothetical protein DFH11DRAFT_1858984 [Phellopilus nigrolimitatus]|nr:hypothetical protein DFH11DRAFT_1858984 [Phellopilus nigrolimitatus]
MTVCGDCGGTVIEYDAAAGNGFCVKCGTVIEENTIVSEVTFGEASSGAAIVQGSFVGQGSTHARMGGPFGNRNSSESREQTIENASRKIRNVAAVLRLSEVVQTAAIRMYTLALEHKFTKGRKNMNVVAVCLYVACRQKETRNYMLIDFSDLLQVNVFELGHTYLQLVQTLNLRLPLVDPSHYISRFAALLEFGDETPKVAADAVRLVARFDRDWMSRGRRPAGICGACLLLAARMNNFRRSLQEIVQVVKIADSTLKKRLDEFKKTPSGALTLADFRTVWLEDEVDPPAFTKGKEREAKEREKENEADNEEEVEDELLGDEIEGVTSARKKSKKKRKKKEKKRKRIEDDVDDADTAPFTEQSTNDPEARLPLDPLLLNEGILAGTSDTLPLFFPDPSLQAGPSTQAPRSPTLRASSPSADIPSLTNEPQAEAFTPSSPPSPLDATVDAALAEEVTDFLQNDQGSALAEALDAAEQRRLSRFAMDDALLDLDEAELDAFILTEDEVKMKERVWVEINKDYLETLAAKEALKDGAEPTKSRKRRKTNAKPRDASTPSGSTAAEAVRNLIKKSTKYSRRINYDALKSLFDGDSAGAAGANAPPPEVDLSDKEEDMYTIDDKSDGEGVRAVVEESGGGVGMSAPAPRRGADKADKVRTDDEDADGEAGVDGEEIEMSEKGDEYVWDEGYEQEV